GVEPLLLSVKEVSWLDATRENRHVVLRAREWGRQIARSHDARTGNRCCRSTLLPGTRIPEIGVPGSPSVAGHVAGPRRPRISHGGPGISRARRGVPPPTPHPPRPRPARGPSQAPRRDPLGRFAPP